MPTLENAYRKTRALNSSKRHQKPFCSSVTSQRPQLFFSRGKKIRERRRFVCDTRASEENDGRRREEQNDTTRHHTLKTFSVFSFLSFTRKRRRKKREGLCEFYAYARILENLVEQVRVLVGAKRVFRDDERTF